MPSFPSSFRRKQACSGLDPGGISRNRPPVPGFRREGAQRREDEGHRDHAVRQDYEGAGMTWRASTFTTGAHFLVWRTLKTYIPGFSVAKDMA